MFKVGPKSIFALLQYQVRSDLKCLKNRLQKTALKMFKVGPNLLFALLKNLVRSNLKCLKNQPQKPVLLSSLLFFISNSLTFFFLPCPSLYFSFFFLCYSLSISNSLSLSFLLYPSLSSLSPFYFKFLPLHKRRLVSLFLCKNSDSLIIKGKFKAAIHFYSFHCHFYLGEGM